MVDWEPAGKWIRNDDTEDARGLSGCYPVGRIFEHDRLMRLESEQ